MAAKLEPLEVLEEAEEDEGYAGKLAAPARAGGKPPSHSNKERLIAAPNKKVKI